MADFSEAETATFTRYGFERGGTAWARPVHEGWMVIKPLEGGAWELRVIGDDGKTEIAGGTAPDLPSAMRVVETFLPSTQDVS